MLLRELTEAIKGKSGVCLPENTVDGLITGDYESEVTGVATTFMATMEVIDQAGKMGLNTIITHEPTFYKHNDKIEILDASPVYREKMDLIGQYGMNIWRFHDAMHYMQQDLIYEGMIKELGWNSYMAEGSQKVFEIPECSTGQLAEELKKKLGMQSLRFVGNKNAVCHRVLYLLGALSLGNEPYGDEKLLRLIETQRIDTLLCGEMLEWTTCAYVRDARMSGKNCSMMILGHNRSEEAAMKHLVEWLQPLCGGKQVQFIEAGEPFLYV